MGTISGLAYFAIVYEIWLGGAAKLAKEAGGDVLQLTKSLLVRTCWLGNLPSWIHGRYSRMVWSRLFFGMEFRYGCFYNIADAINKIGFGLVIYSLACKKTA